MDATAVATSMKAVGSLTNFVSETYSLVTRDKFIQRQGAGPRLIGAFASNNLCVTSYLKRGYMVIDIVVAEWVWSSHEHCLSVHCMHITYVKALRPYYIFLCSSYIYVAGNEAHALSIESCFCRYVEY